MERPARQGQREDDDGGRHADEAHERLDKLLGPQAAHDAAVETEHVELEGPEDDKVARQAEEEHLRAVRPLRALLRAHVLALLVREIGGVAALGDLDEDLADYGGGCPHSLVHESFEHLSAWRQVKRAGSQARLTATAITK